MAENMRVWNALMKTDPKHTKAISRAGGFKGTAIKPIYSTLRMTELFGPCGEGWGMTKPEFQVVTSDGEILVFCTVGLWHVAHENMIYGVGGDKVLTKRQSGTFNNDEAFKASYTDALGNAMKQLGVSADVHMGLFDDHKYRAEVEREFAGEPAKPARQQLDSPKAAAPVDEWHLLGNELKAEIDAALDTVAVAEILESKRFIDLAKHSKSAGDFLSNRAKLKIGTISQGPTARRAA